MTTLPPGFVQEGDAFRALRAALERPTPILNGVGALLLATSQRAFREERMGRVKWKSRADTGMVPNWPGILADFAAGKSQPPNRRMESGNTLSDTGRLRGSVSWRVVGQDTVEVGSVLPYAAVLHSGGESQTVTITEALQKKMWEWIKKSGGGSGASKASKSSRDSDARKRLGDSFVDGAQARLKILRSRMEGNEGSDSYREYARERREILASLKPGPRLKLSKTAKWAAKDELAAINRLDPRSLDAERARGRKASLEGALGSARNGGSPRSSAGESMAGKLRWLLNPKLRGQRLTVNHPARPIVGVPDDVVEKVEHFYGVTIRGN